MQQITLNDLLQHEFRESAMDRLMEAKAKGRRAMQAVAENSGPDFQDKAYEFCERFFREKGKASSEDATEALIAAGIVPHDKRAMGPVIVKLIGNNVIRFAGNCQRRFGHGTSGGRLYEVCQ